MTRQSLVEDVGTERPQARVGSAHFGKRQTMGAPSACVLKCETDRCRCACAMMADLAQLWAQRHGKYHCKDGTSCRQVCFTEPAAWQVVMCMNDTVHGGVGGMPGAWCFKGRAKEVCPTAQRTSQASKECSAGSQTPCSLVRLTGRAGTKTSSLPGQRTSRQAWQSAASPPSGQTMAACAGPLALQPPGRLPGWPAGT